MKYENYDYYEKTFGEHAKLTSTTKGKDFIPMYTYNPIEPFEQEFKEKIDKSFVPMKWPHYYELFGAN